MPNPPVVTNLETSPHPMANPDRGAQYRVVDGYESKLAVYVNEMRKGASQGSYHYHADSDNFYLCLSGTIEIFVGNERHLLRPNEVALVPRGVPHSSGIRDGDGPASVLEIYAPPRAKDDSIKIDRPKQSVDKAK